METKAFEKFVPLIVAVISAAALLFGYMYEKDKEKEAEIRKTRQDIYSRLATNITQRIHLLDRIYKTPEWRNAKNEQEQYDVSIQDTALSKNLSDMKEIAALLCIYGPDDAIKAYANWLIAGYDPTRKADTSSDLGKLILALRKSIYPETSTTVDEANVAIWNDARHLNKSSPAK